MPDPEFALGMEYVYCEAIHPRGLSTEAIIILHLNLDDAKPLDRRAISLAQAIQLHSDLKDILTKLKDQQDAENESKGTWSPNEDSESTEEESDERNDDE